MGRSGGKKKYYLIGWNEDIWYKVGVASMVDKISEAEMVWAHEEAKCRYPMRRCDWLLIVGVRRGRGRPKM